MSVEIIPHVVREKDEFVAYCREYGTVGRGKTVERAITQLKIATKKVLHEFGIDDDIVVLSVVYEFL